MDGRQLELLVSKVPSLGGTGAGRGAGSLGHRHRCWCSRRSPGASPQAGHGAVPGVSRHRHPSQPSPPALLVASAVPQPHPGTQSGPALGVTPPARCGAKRVPVAV